MFSPRAAIIFAVIGTLFAAGCNPRLFFGGGPVGLNSLAVAIGEDAGTLEDVNEPYLIMQGYLKRTPQGRVAMPVAYKKLGITAPRRDGELL